MFYENEQKNQRIQEERSIQADDHQESASRATMDLLDSEGHRHLRTGDCAELGPGTRTRAR